MKKMIIVLSVLIYSSVAKAGEDNPFAWMYINCLTHNIRYVGDIVIEFYPDETIKVLLPYNFDTGRLGGRGEGTWNARNSFFTANFMVTLNDEEQEISFSISGMTMRTSITSLSRSPKKYFSVLGTGEIVDPECALSEEEKTNVWCFGVFTSDSIRNMLLNN